MRGTDTEGRAWSACLPNDGGEEPTTNEDGGQPLAKDTSVDAPWTPDGTASADVERPEATVEFDGSSDLSLCTEGVTRSCALDGLLGNCAKGTEICTNGKWGSCSIVTQAADKCDVAGDDANCNGKPNEGCPCVTGEKQPCGPSIEQGICRRGTQTCANAQWGSCEGAVYPKARDCTSAADNDCDGKADNSIDSVCQCNPVNGTRPCDTHPQDGTGPCRAGSQVCQAGANNGSTRWGTCSGGVGPATSDSCVPGNDANCNGSPNENCKALGQGCNSNGDCLSGHCVQGTCCGSACPAASPSTCGNDGTCDGSGTCRKYSNGTICQSASCSDRNNAHEVSTCQAGACKPGKLCDYHGCDDNSHCTTICPGGTNDTGTQCEPCGAEGQHCCGLNLCNSSTLGCIMSTADGMLYCTKCGGLNERCCPGSSCRTGQCLPTKTGPPACQNCGLLGQTCCANMQCSQGTCGTDAVGFPVCK